MIYRLAEPTDWEQARRTGFFASADLATEGFIHASDKHQILDTATRYYAGRADLLLLEIDEGQLRAAGVRLVREWVEARQQAFAHVFDAIPLRAITRHWDFQPNAAGHFTLPAGLADL